MSSNELALSKRAAQDHLDLHRGILADLDELGDILTEMHEREDAVEVCDLRHPALTLVFIDIVADAIFGTAQSSKTATIHDRRPATPIYCFSVLLLQAGSRAHSPKEICRYN